MIPKASERHLPLNPPLSPRQIRNESPDKGDVKQCKPPFYLSLLTIALLGFINSKTVDTKNLRESERLQAGREFLQGQNFLLVIQLFNYSFNAGANTSAGLCINRFRNKVCLMRMTLTPVRTLGLTLVVTRFIANYQSAINNLI